ncbi:hypothetical protein [Aneurinibacillus thermoaerophilus]|uniref:hypothetical protein n=1 Tax=Aneurinibacillus thermoaerophilus TaxID=143495 RepID=UPI002E1F291F|nr:hypothetical protein [Aneurinibacillus thermoaerophilus]
MQFELLDYLILAGGLAYFILNKRNKKAQETKPKETVEDWLQVKEIDEDGLIHTEDGRFLYILAVRPIPLFLKSKREKDIVWSAFRNVAEMVTHPIRLRSQSHPFRLDDYFQSLKGLAIEQEDAGNMEYAHELEETFGQIVELNKIQDQHYFLILEMSQRFAVELSAEITHPLLNEMVLKRAAMKPSDIETIRQELRNSRSIVEQYFLGCGIHTLLLDKEGVLEYVYANVNREMAAIMPYQELKDRTALPNHSVPSLTKMQHSRWVNA